MVETQNQPEDQDPDKTGAPQAAEGEPGAPTAEVPVGEGREDGRPVVVNVHVHVGHNPMEGPYGLLEFLAREMSEEIGIRRFRRHLLDPILPVDPFGLIEALVGLEPATNRRGHPSDGKDSADKLAGTMCELEALTREMGEEFGAVAYIFGGCPRHGFHCPRR